MNIENASDALRHMMSFDFLGGKVTQVVTFADGSDMRAMIRLGYVIMPRQESSAVSYDEVWLYLRWSKVKSGWSAGLCANLFDVNTADNSTLSSPKIRCDWQSTLWLALSTLAQTYRGMVNSGIQIFESVFGVKVPDEAKPSELFPSAALKVMWSIEQARMEDQKRIKNQAVIEPIAAEVVADNETAEARQEASDASPD